jgi:hypothetical protein
VVQIVEPQPPDVDRCVQLDEDRRGGEQVQPSIDGREDRHRRRHRQRHPGQRVRRKPLERVAVGSGLLIPRGGSAGGRRGGRSASNKAQLGQGAGIYASSTEVTWGLYCFVGRGRDLYPLEPESNEPLSRDDTPAQAGLPRLRRVRRSQSGAPRTRGAPPPRRRPRSTLLGGNRLFAPTARTETHGGLAAVGDRVGAAGMAAPTLSSADRRSRPRSCRGNTPGRHDGACDHDGERAKRTEPLRPDHLHRRARHSRRARPGDRPRHPSDVPRRTGPARVVEPRPDVPRARARVPRRADGRGGAGAHRDARRPAQLSAPRGHGEVARRRRCIRAPALARTGGARARHRLRPSRVGGTTRCARRAACWTAAPRCSAGRDVRARARSDASRCRNSRPGCSRAGATAWPSPAASPPPSATRPRCSCWHAKCSAESGSPEHAAGATTRPPAHCRGALVTDPKGDAGLRAPPRRLPQRRAGVCQATAGRALSDATPG